MMKYTLIAGLLFTSTAYAGEVEADIKDHYRTVIERVPHTTTRCETVQVPMYSESKKEFNTEGAILGGLVGGLLGNQVGRGSGREVATGAGAVAGAIIGGGGGKSERVIVGYKEERQCKDVTTYTDQSRRVYSHSTITFIDNGRRIVLRYNGE